jgi:hypothetical protein
MPESPDLQQLHSISPQLINGVTIEQTEDGIVPGNELLKNDK